VEVDFLGVIANDLTMEAQKLLGVKKEPDTPSPQPASKRAKPNSMKCNYFLTQQAFNVVRNKLAANGIHSESFLKVHTSGVVCGGWRPFVEFIVTGEGCIDFCPDCTTYGSKVSPTLVDELKAEINIMAKRVAPVGDVVPKNQLNPTVRTLLDRCDHHDITNRMFHRCRILPTDEADNRRIDITKQIRLGSIPNSKRWQGILRDAILYECEHCDGLYPLGKSLQHAKSLIQHFGGKGHERAAEAFYTKKWTDSDAHRRR
jgi:hypothetical protein